MKKLIFAILSLSVLLTSNASADGYCKGWEHGSTQYVNDPEIIGYFPTSLEPCCWEVSEITGWILYNGQLYSDVKLDVAGYSNSYYDFFALMQKNVYGENHYGMYVKVEVYGLPQDRPTITLQGRQGIYISDTPIYSPSGSIHNGKEYTFYVPRTTVTQATYLSDVDVYSQIKIYDGATLKDDYPFMVYYLTNSLNLFHNYNFLLK